MPQDWYNFYYLIGSAAAGLIGLMFVVVTLTAGRERSTVLHAAGLYLTPTLAHFAVVLATSATALAPNLPGHLRGGVLGAIEAMGLFYAARATIGIAWPRPGASPAHPSDLWCYGVAPTAIYLGLCGVIGLTFWPREAWAPIAMAGLLLALLLLAIRNAWDLVTWMAAARSAS